jgi:predicted MFS family arabinose efflux permease
MSITAYHLQGEARAKAVGWIVISLPTSAIVTSLIANFLTSLGSWQLPFLIVLLPINILSVFLVTLYVPSAAQQSQSINESMFRGFTEILTDRSAIACLIGTVCSALSIGGFMAFHVAFFRQFYQMSLDVASYIVMSNWLVMGIGSWSSRHLVRRLGSRKLWAFAMVLAGFSIILALIVPNLWIALPFASSVFLQMGFAFTAASNLALDQAPRFSGTFMALFTASNSIGMTLGPFLGGMILLWSNYRMLGLCLGPIGLLAAIILYFWVHERS